MSTDVSQGNKRAPKKLKVMIAQLRGVPVTSGIFLKEHKAITLDDKANGYTEYKKLKPGEIQEVTQAEYHQLSEDVRGMLTVV